jgi:DNA-binding SARP family transcriptional activator
MDLSVQAVYIYLLGGFDSTYCGTRITLPLGAQRLLSFLALWDRGVHRTIAAERLWPDSSVSRAAANLRSALWRGRRIGETTVIECVGPRLRLSPSVCVDLHIHQRHAQQILEGSFISAIPDCEALVDALSRELLPAWAEDWLVLERDRWDQVRLHALEELAQQLCSAELYLGALKTALAAIAIEPIRETAHRIFIEVHLAEGNAASALRHYQRYRALLQRELGVGPSPRMTELASALLPS